MWKLVALYGIVLATLVDGRTLEKYSPSYLRRAIFNDYDAKALPVSEAGERVPVTAALTPIYIREVDEAKEIIVVDAWIKMTWTDKQLTWDPDEYSGIKSLNVPSGDIWRPDISTYTATPDAKILPVVQTNAIVYYTGAVTWVPPLTINSRCPLDLSKFPNDVQRCNIAFGSWTFGSLSIDFRLDSEEVDTSVFQDNNPEWSLQEANVQWINKTYPCCPNESYPLLNYTLTLRRKGSSETCIANTVSTFALILSAVMFFLPPDSAQKIVVGILTEVLLGLVALFLGSVLSAPGAKLKASEGVYQYMVVVAAFIFLEVVVVNIARVTGPYRPPRWLLVVCRDFCQPFGVCFSKKYSDVDEEKVEASTTIREEWKIIALAIDRILLIIGVIVVVSFKVL